MGGDLTIDGRVPALIGGSRFCGSARSLPAAELSAIGDPLVGGVMPPTKGHQSVCRAVHAADADWAGTLVGW